MVLRRLDTQARTRARGEDGPPLPAYKLPPLLVGKLVGSVLVGGKRSSAADAGAAIKHLHPEPEIVGAANVPAERACLVTCNHYTRPGFDAWWTGLSITAAIAAQRAPGSPKNIHWVMTAAWRYPEGDWRHRVVTPLTRWAFARVADVYDMITMPPMPPSPEEVEARAVAVLRTVRLARRVAAEGGLLGLAPEGRDSPNLLGEPPAGAGEFIALLVRTGLPILPVGVSEPDGRLRISFGAPFVPEMPQTRPARDHAVIRQVMDAIAAQLPAGPSETNWEPL
ncbi:MAG: lysophospholipid acyltransferase family protein [Anaerolineae bacterium]